MTDRSENRLQDEKGRKRTASPPALKKADQLLKKGKFDEAARFLETVIEGEPQNPRYLLKLAALRRGQGRIEEAIDLASQVVAMPEETLSAKELLLQLYLEDGQYNQVIDRGKLFVKTAPRNIYFRDLMGAAYLQLGQLDKALQVTNELVHLHPTDAANHFKRAVLFQQKGELGKAIREFGRVLDLDPDSHMADDARAAINSLDTFQIRQIVALAMEDKIFRAKLLRDAEASITEKGFFLSQQGVQTLRQIDFEGFADPWNLMSDQPTYH